MSHPVLGGSGTGSGPGTRAGIPSFTGGLTTSGTTGVVLAREGGGESAGEGVLLEDCLVSLLARLCCKSALICFIAGACSCSVDSGYIFLDLFDSPSATSWAEHLLIKECRAAIANLSKVQLHQGLRNEWPPGPHAKYRTALSAALHCLAATATFQGVQHVQERGNLFQVWAAAVRGDARTPWNAAQLPQMTLPGYQ